MRAVRVTFTNGSKLDTSVADHITDAEIRAYYRKGKVFNIGNVKDRMTKVKSVKIIK